MREKKKLFPGRIKMQIANKDLTAIFVKHSKIRFAFMRSFSVK